MAQLRAALALGPLLAGRVEVQEFVLVDPVIRLQSRNGVNNWSFGAAGDAAPAASASDGFVRAPGALPFDASFGDVRIENGAVFYDDGQQRRQIEALNLAVSLPSVDAPVRLDGGFDADGRPMRFALELGSLRGFFEGQQTAFSLDLTGALAEVSANGRFLESPDLTFDGRVSMTLPLRALARYLGTDLPDGDIFQEFAAQAQMSGAPGRFALTDAAVRFDAIRADGDLQLEYAGPRPVITGAVHSPRLDITPYIPADTAPGGAGASGSEGIAPWSEAPLDVAALRAMDVNLDITADLLKSRDIEVTDVLANLVVDRGRLVATLQQFRLYGGSGRAVAVLNARQQTPSLSFNANLETLQAQPFLTAAAGFDRLLGVGEFNLDVTSSGASPAAIMDNLTGNGGFAFTDGAVRGVNLAQMIRTVQSAVTNRALPAAFAETEKTDFSSLTGGFTIQNGVVRNEDLLMLSPLLRVAGDGEIDLGAQTVNYLISPRAVQALTGQGGDVNLQGLTVPVRLRGDFNTVSAGIDFDSVAAALLQQQAGRLLGLENTPDQPAPESAEDAVRGLFGQFLNNAINRSDEDEPTDTDEDSPN